jgi:LuxR family maltose regulon positive regulatory protein
VGRRRLLERLEQAGEHRLTFLSAPPGFGKTVLVAQWLEERRRTAAWLSLDAFDSDPESFVRYLVAAIGGAAGWHFPETNALLAAQQAPPFRYLCDVLVSEPARAEEPLVAVLDDYHAVASEEVQRLLERLVPVLSPALHVVVLTRRDPRGPSGTGARRGGSSSCGDAICGSRRTTRGASSRPGGRCRCRTRPSRRWWRGPKAGSPA